ncbi:MAG: hypothetical protein ACI9EF_001230 [Pseudohongiellaceae bacterium]|jgi:hypothetical protein
MTDSENIGPTLETVLAAMEARDLSDQEALFVLSLIADGRDVPEKLSRLAHRREAESPDVAAALGDFGLISGALSDLSGEEPVSPDFTSRVLDQARESASTSTVVSMDWARRLAVAATLLLSVSLSWDALRPTPAAADPSQERQVYRGDVFRQEVYGPYDMDRGLRELLPGRLDGLNEGPPMGLGEEFVGATSADAAGTEEDDDSAATTFDGGDDR